MISIEDLLSAGYKEYSTNNNWKNADRFFQKTIYNDNKTLKLYFINIAFYEFSKNSIGRQLDITYDSFSFEVYFYDQDERCIQITICIKSTDNDDIQTAEDYFDKFFWVMGFIPDPHNN